MNIKIFGGCNIGVIVAGVITCILGIIIASNDMKTTDRCWIHPEDQDSVDGLNGFVDLLGLITIATGIITIIGGGLGTGAGFTSNKCLITSACVLLSIAVILMHVATLFTLGMAVAIQGECDKRTCNDFDYNCPVDDCIDGGAGSDDCRSWCKDHYDFFCEDIVGSFFITGIILVIILIGVTISMSCACAACCCCPQKFELQQSQQQAPPVVQPTVIGTVVNNA